MFCSAIGIIGCDKIRQGANVAEPGKLSFHSFTSGSLEANLPGRDTAQTWGRGAAPRYNSAMRFGLRTLLLGDIFVHDTYVEVSQIWIAVLVALGVLIIAAIGLAIWLAIRHRE